jgi:hypothetical protein
MKKIETEVWKIRHHFLKMARQPVFSAEMVFSAKMIIPV